MTKKSLSEIIFSDPEQKAALQGFFSVMLVQLVLLALTGVYVYLAFIVLSSVDSRANLTFFTALPLSALITNILYHIAMLFNGENLLGEYGYFKGVVIWYFISIFVINLLLSNFF